MIQVVTTFSKDGYELYGKRMIETWLSYWPTTDYQLIVYVEDFDLNENNYEIIQRDIYECCPELIDFKKASMEMIANHPNDGKYEKRIQKTIKWSHKVFVNYHAITHCDTNYLIFLDGDTYTTNVVPSNFAEELCGEDLLAVHFEMLMQGLHFETGLLIFNTRHERIEEFAKLYISGYHNLEIYERPKTWDSFWLVHLYKTYSLPIKNLGWKYSKRAFPNELVRTILEHDVGPEKYKNLGYNRYTGKKLI